MKAKYRPIALASACLLMSSVFSMPESRAQIATHDFSSISSVALMKGGVTQKYPLSRRPWDIAPALQNRFETSRFPGWVDPVPADGNQGPDELSLKLYELLKRPLPKLVRKPLLPVNAPQLPWFDLKKIPYIPATDENPEKKILTPMITGSFQLEGRIALFQTTDDHLYYVVPNRWLVSLNGLTVDRSPKADNVTRLRFLLSPSYAWADDLIQRIKTEDPLAFFVPIPKTVVDFRLDMPGMIGEVKNQILPTDAMSIGDQIYMNLELDEEQLEIFRLLNESKTFLTGSVSFTYPYDAHRDFKLVADIWLNFQDF